MKSEEDRLQSKTFRRCMSSTGKILQISLVKKVWGEWFIGNRNVVEAFQDFYSHLVEVTA